MSSLKRKRVRSAVKDGPTSTPETNPKRTRANTNRDSKVKSLQKFKLSPDQENVNPSGIGFAPQDSAVEDIVAALMEKRKIVRHPGTRPLSMYSGNLMHFAQNLQYGCRTTPKLKKSIIDTIGGQVSQLQLYRSAAPFQRRTTVIEWHPTNPHLVAVGSKFGEVLLWDINTINNDIMIPATGPNGSIQALKFLPNSSSSIITASINGTVSTHVLGKNQKEIFMDTMNSYHDWYCSLDVHRERNLAAVGDNHGSITLKSLKDRKNIFEFRLHKSKVTHLEFSPREEWLLASASVDNTVQLWDIRMLQDRKSALTILKHNRAVNSGIEAFWHPLCDLIVVGRYPDENFEGHKPGELRTIDMFSADSGKLLCQLYDPHAKGIITLNKFSHNGEYLASGMGVNVLVWSMQHEVEERHSSLMTAMKNSGLIPGAKRTKTNRDLKQTKGHKESGTASRAKLNLKIKTKTVNKKR